MKKCASILLTLVLLFNIGGYYVWYCALQQSIQKNVALEIRKGIHEQDLTMLEVTPENASALIWTQPNKEFKYQGEMYDVVKVKCDRQKTYYYCLGDQKEKLLIANFNIAHNTHKDLEKKLKRATVLSFYLPPTSITKIQYPIHILFAEPIGHYISNMVEIHSPPPKSA